MMNDLNQNPVSPWLAGLNTSQSDAVTSLQGPLLVLSGAGTGKTRVLTSRLAELVASGTAKPWNILAVTFTNKAAREMKSRIGDMVGPMVEQVWLGTFHSLAAKMLRRHADLVGLKSDFTILDSDDQVRLVKQLMAAENIDPKRWPARMVAGVISRWKDRGLVPEKISLAEAGDVANGRMQQLYKDYQARLLTLNAVDFGDLLLHMLTIFQHHPDVLADYHGRITHIMVDEYQDTNVAQYLWLRLLTGQRNNLCCVGDDDQSIYGWRGAEVGNILRFESDFPGAKTVRLEENYRSTGHILAAASTVIARNETRLGKTLFTSADDGEKVRVNGYWDGADEARSISSHVESMQQNGAHLSQIAVLVRAGFQTREFEERFIAIGLPYRVVGARFYERAEIRDAIAYLRLIAQPADDLAFERIINVPKRGLGTASIQAIHIQARASQKPLLAAAIDLVETEELRPAARTALGRFVQDIGRWRNQIGSLHQGDLARMVLDESGYTTMWQMDKSPDAEGRLENLTELVSAMQDFDSLQGFLEHISLVMDGDTVSEQGEVTLMTLHAAKGLEFDTVFLPGWEEGIFPSQRTMDENGAIGLEEERRLAYVGITRARKNVHISFASSRRVHGQWQSAIPSRFVQELPAENIIEDMAQGMGIGRVSPAYISGASDIVGQQGYGPGWRRMANRQQQGTENRFVAETNGAAFIRGDRVFHQKFGMGNVVNVEGDKLEISFDKAGHKKVVSGFVSKP
ncbi:ATP-dependent helicase [Candidatus Puniceispirillum marinum]|uniref:DNA 3'-5' helicase n=1 Tax=Puniceispirillum marinum (strain IMCC1322) TaxID=488538 RepID=D5BPR2_PUNMI|nr:UvrD-helicase domain-containing protein [Candidatus Puniceispirillum marinum]ADE40564.1 DNA helicase II [Candidatus Puniceispirillum marinum IMCC1322]